MHYSSIRRKFSRIHNIAIITVMALAGGPLTFAADGDLAKAGAASKAGFEGEVRFTQGGFVNKDGKVQMDNATAKFSDKIQYPGGDLEIKGLSGVNAALVLFYDKETLLKAVSGAEYNDKSTFISEGDIPAGTTHFIVNGTVGREVVIKVNGKSVIEDSSPIANESLSKRGRYQFGSSANYDVSNLPIQADFVLRNSSEIYALYDGLVAAHPDYVTKINLETEADTEGIMKPKELAEYGFYMYRFRPTYAPVGVNHKSAQIFNEIKVMVVTGTHDEPYSVETLFNMMRWICEDWRKDVNAEDMRFNVTFYIIPCGNPWAFSQPNAGGGGNVRTNYNGVDLNRNMPSKDWVLRPKGRTYSGPTPGSEYESKVLMQQIDKIKPTVFVDFHNYGTDLQGHLFYTMTTGQDGHDICAEVQSKNSRTLKKLNTDYPQDTETILGWMRDNNERGSREGYAHERGALSFVYECCPGYVWNGGKLGTVLNRSGDGVVMRDNLISFSYFMLRVLHEISMREGVPNGLSLPKYP